MPYKSINASVKNEKTKQNKKKKKTNEVDKIDGTWSTVLLGALLQVPSNVSTGTNCTTLCGWIKDTP